MKKSIWLNGFLSFLMLFLFLAPPVFPQTTVKITELDADTTPTGDDLLIIVDMAGPTTKKATITNLLGTNVAEVRGAISVITKSADGANTITAAQAYGTLVLLGHVDAISDLALPDYQAAADVDHVALGASVCVWAASAYAHTIHPAGDDKIRTSNGTLNAAGAGVTYTTASTPIGGFVCFVLTDAASDVGHWTQFGMNGTWPIH